MIRPRRWGKVRRSLDRIDGGMSRFLLKDARQAFSRLSLFGLLV